MALTGVDGSAKNLSTRWDFEPPTSVPGGTMRRLTAQEMRKMNGGKPCNDLNAAIVIMSIIDPIGAAILIGIWLSQGCQNAT
jgi:hypothetical protein